MRIYHSGGTGAELRPKAEKWVKFMQNRLLSYAYMTPTSAKRYRDNRSKFNSIMLDSGAFTAWTKGINLDLQKYAEFVEEFDDIFEFVVSIDRIPSIPGCTDPAKLINCFKESAEVSWDNAQELLRLGIKKEKLIPVFHQGEDFKWLDKMIKFEFNVIGISPGNDRGPESKTNWMETCFSRMRPGLKFHGFAVTSSALMRDFEWFSVDSASWMIASGHGHLLIPSNNFKDYLNPEIISVSKHRDFIRLKGLEDFLDRELGLTTEEISSHHVKRVEAYLFTVEKFRQEVLILKPYENKVKRRKGFSI